MLPIRTVLHPTDLSHNANRAFQLARMIARESNARLIVLHVHDSLESVPPMAFSELGNAFVIPTDVPDVRATLTDELLQRFASEPDTRVELRLSEGDAADEIVRISDEIPCDLIVMGTHGRSGLDRLLMGSVAESVLREARCPVLTVKTPVEPETSPHDEPARESVKTQVTA